MFLRIHNIHADVVRFFCYPFSLAQSARACILFFEGPSSGTYRSISHLVILAFTSASGLYLPPRYPNGTPGCIALVIAASGCIVSSAPYHLRCYSDMGYSQYAPYL